MRHVPRVNRSLDELRLLGGSLPLDFVNSVDWRADARPVEYLDDYEAVLTWSTAPGNPHRARSDSAARKLRARPRGGDRSRDSTAGFA